MAKRNLLSQLPVVHQTKTLQQFFNATVNQVFQPGDTQSVNAFIGRKPSYFDPKRDFYKSEYDASRAFYQLEPAMTSRDTLGVATDMLCYPDLINQLRFQGADTSNQERMLESDYYSWCPPINIDKLTQYRDYYWLPSGPPVMVIDLGYRDDNNDGRNDNPYYARFIADGITTVYQLPSAIPGAVIDYMIYINGVRLLDAPVIDGNIDDGILDGNNPQGITIDGNMSEGFTISNNQVTFTGPWSPGTIIEIWVNGDYKQNIVGKPSYTHPVPVYGYITVEIPTSNGVDTVTYGPSIIEVPPKLQLGMYVEIIDNTGKNLYEVAFDSNGDIELVEPNTDGLPLETPMYWTIEANAENLNRWSRSNHWYHKSVMFFSHENYVPTQAVRPIIEFVKDLKLINHGWAGRGEVNAIWNDPNESPYSAIGSGISAFVAFDLHGIILPNTSGTIDFRLLVRNTNYQPADKKILEGTLDIHVMAYDSDFDDPTSSNWGMPEAPFWEVGADVSYLEDANQVAASQAGDVTALIGEPESLWFDGFSWELQQWNNGQEPLFDLYDTQDTPLTQYPVNNFSGSKIFAYKRGTLVDSILGIDVSRNQYGNLEFLDHISSDIFTSSNAVIPGIKFYARVNNRVFKYNTIWLPAGTTTQPIVDGQYSIPLNLQANPLNYDVSTISVNEWNKQLKEVRLANDWYSGSDHFDLSVGRSILQHRSPLLKTMLTCSNTSLDIQKAIMFSEREYLRFRNKFNQTLNGLTNIQSITDIQTTLMQVLNILKSAKTSEFPFFNNGIIGEFYIPATGAYLGTSLLWQPEMFVENDVMMIRGHDGSLTRGSSAIDPVTNTMITSKRDQVTVALEQAIYNSAQSDIKTRRPIFDLAVYTSTKFHQGDYSRDEVLAIERPQFEKWAAMNNYKYRENNTYNADNPFTWNFSSVMDVDGEPLPGYWRGIYRYYFGTDRPHTHPWEMLGYTSEPSTWEQYYAWDNSAKRALLINAIEQGIIDPITGEIDSVFARPDFGRFVPVSDSGELLNPVQAGIVVDANVQNYSKEWKFGDGAPVENMWRNSFALSFNASHLSYLMKPARFVESTWVAGDQIQANGQWFSKATKSRKFDATARVHNEVVDNVAIRVIGLQTWISDYIKQQGSNITTTFGDKVRGLDVNIVHKLGGFTDPVSVKTFTENSGSIPQENVSTALYRSPSIREEFYGGMVIEWTGSSWRVFGYDISDPVFNTFSVAYTGKKHKISIGGESQEAYDWRIDTYYTEGILIQHNGTNYRCLKTHTSGRSFEQSYWNPEPMAKFSPGGSVVWYRDHTDELVRVPYGTEFFTRQDIAEFISGYQAYLISRGWVFDQYDDEVNRIKDFQFSTQEFLYWSQNRWDAGTVITLSPSATSVKFKTDHGAIQNVEQLVHGVYSLLDRSGAAIPPSTVTVDRSDSEISIGVLSGGIYGSRVFVSEVEQILVFDNKTIFNDTIYDPLFNLRQNRIRIILMLSTPWTGRLDAPGFVITDNRLVPSFERQVGDVRYMYDVEKTTNLPLTDNARHQIGYQNREYLENLMYNDVNQFEFYQGMIKQKGAPGVFKKLMRNDELTQTRTLSFLEEWAFRRGVYGGVESRSTFEFKLPKTDIRQDPQLIVSEDYDGDYDGDLSNLDSQEDTTITLYTGSHATDSRWIEPFHGSMFTKMDSFVRPVSALPTAGYLRVSDAKWCAHTLESLKVIIEADIEDIQLGDRVWIHDIDNSWNIFRTILHSPINSIVSFVPGLNGTTITFAEPTTFKVGDIIYIEKIMAIDSEQLVGAHIINDVSEDGLVIRIPVDTLNAKYYAVDEEQAMTYKLESVRFRKDTVDTTLITSPTLDQFQMDDLGIVAEYQNGELIYVDVCYEFAYQKLMPVYVKRWAVYQKTSLGLERVRSQPSKICRNRVLDVKIFEDRSTRTALTLNAKPLLFSDIIVYDPNQGLIPGVIDVELFYKLEYDPAFYNTGPSPSLGLGWGKEQVGRLWWDLSTVRFLVAETNDTDDGIELAYRIKNWGNLAPDSHVDIWEWTASSVTPIEWQANFENGNDPTTYDGEVLNPQEPDYVTEQIWDPALNRIVPVYYFWVKNRSNVPNLTFRSSSAAQVAAIIRSPSLAGISWMAPLAEDSLIISGIAQFLNQNSSVQFTVSKNDNDNPRHVDWELMRDQDERSLPAQYLWNKFITTLSHKTVWNDPIPSMNRYPTDRIGYDVERGQSLFKNISNARKSTVQRFNQMMDLVPVVDVRRSLEVLDYSDGKVAPLQWSQQENSLYIAPLPSRQLWNKRYKSTNDLLDDSTAIGDNLVYGLDDQNSFWSVIRKTDDGSLSIVDLYVHTVDSLTALNDLKADIVSGSVTDIQVGDRVKVDDNTNIATGGFWTLWEWNNNDFTLIDNQRFDSSTIWTYVDWYQTGYSDMPAPLSVFATANQRNNAAVTDPNLKFAKVLDDGRGRWMWTELVDGIWLVVAKQNGTIHLTDDVWSLGGNNDGEFVTFGVSLAEFDANQFTKAVMGRDRGYELNKFLNAAHDEILTGIEINELFFNWINYAHTEQDFVDWCFKTSFMYVTGYNDKLRQDPIAFADLTGNLLSYINEVKPYHVKVRDFISRYGIDPELANVLSIDFDKPAYFDPILGVDRILDDRIPADLVIIQNGIWKYWYTQLTQNGNSKVRKLNPSHKILDIANLSIDETIKMSVWRLNGLPKTNEYGWDIIFYDGAAAYDWDESISTADYVQRYLNFSEYGVATNNWTLFEWEGNLPNPRVLARKVNDGVDTVENVSFEVFQNVNYNLDPMFIIDIITRNKAGEWKVVGAGTVDNTPL